MIFFLHWLYFKEDYLCAYAHVPTQMCAGVGGGQKAAPDPMELALKVVRPA